MSRAEGMLILGQQILLLPACLDSTNDDVGPQLPDNFNNLKDKWPQIAEAYVFRDFGLGTDPAPLPPVRREL